MKFNHFFLFFSFLAFSICSSCIKNEAPNAEADIVTATIDHASELLQTNPTITNSSVSFRLRYRPENHPLAPRFTLSPGATIDPASGTERDFSEPRQYTVTSQDGHWHKTYKVSFIVDDSSSDVSSFENVDTINTEKPKGHYEVFFDYLPDGQKIYNWSSGNAGYNIVAATLVPEGDSLTPDFYPTVQTPNGFIGKGVKLQTRSTGGLGSFMGSPLAAGNLFIGTFKLAVPPIKSPRFGQPYTYKTAPIAVRGFFKYKAGKDFKVNNEPSKLTKDIWNGYAILFKKRKDSNYLSGDHHFEDSRIVSVARLKPDQQIETDKWTPFEMPFKFVDGKSFNPSNEYMYTIVFTSSSEGDIFNGATGSTLWIDEVRMVTDTTK